MESREPGDVALAYQVMERMRARMLLDRLDAGRLTEALAPGDPELELDERTSRVSAARSNPRFGAVRQPELPALAEIQAALEPDQAMIAYPLGGSGAQGSWALVVTRDGATPVRLPFSGSLDREVGTYLALLARRDGSDGAAAARLHELLLRDVLAVLPAGVRRLILLPDRALLARDFETSVAPSFAVWHRWRAAPAPQASAPMLALADPTLHARPGESLFRLAESSGLETGLGGLPHARREVRAMGRCLGRGSRILTGERATEQALKDADLAAFRVIHLAAHTIVDERRQERSAVVLAPGADEEDGLLQFREVVELDLQGRIVILSACRSASGPVVGGDGVMGLANAFFLAGSRTVVAGLWPLRDDEASRLMEEFAEALSHGATVASGLATARRSLIQRGAPAAAWAGLVVFGDGDQVPRPGAREARGSGGRAAVVVGGLALVLILALRVWRRA